MAELRRFLAASVAVPFVVGAVVAATPDEPREVVLRFADPDVVEASGLVARDGLYSTVNDSGDTGRLFTADADGRTVGTTTWGEATDVEALAPVEDDVLVGDIGDNLGERESVSILRVPVGRGEQQADPTTAVELVYPGGPRDAESLMVDPVSGRVLLATKGVLGGSFYEVPPDAVPPSVGAPAPVAPVRLRELGGVRALATDGAFFPDGRHLVVRDYGGATVYSFPDLVDVGSFDLPAQEQGEGIAVEEVGGEAGAGEAGSGEDASYRVLVGSEGVDSEVLVAPLPQALAETVAPLPASDGGDGGAGASGGGTGQDQQPPAVVTPPGAQDLPVAGDEAAGPGPGPWLVGGLFLLGVLVVLLRSLRPR